MTIPHILVVDDEADIRGLLKEILSEEGYEVDVAANAVQARASRARQTPDLVLLDIWMPDVDGISLLREWSASTTDGCPVVMMSGHGTVETAVEATRLGAFDFVEKPLSLAKLLRTVERALDAGKRRKQSGKFLSPALVVPVGKSKQMQQLRTELQQIAANPSSVLLVGEPGSGREAFARYLHERGPRAGHPFVTLIASSLREPDAESRLFGREGDPRGNGAPHADARPDDEQAGPAQVGATMRRAGDPQGTPRTEAEQAIPAQAAAGAAGGTRQTGLLEEAAGGTLFIHEVEDLPPSAQRLLVGVLESGQFMRMGGAEPVRLTARVLSSAQPGIENRAGAEGFRRDLLAHLNMLIVRVPPLRDYAEDVPELLRHYVDRVVDTEGLQFRRFSVAAQNRLRNYPWPDNVRELKNLVHRLLIQGGAEEIRLEEIERELAVQAPPGEPLVKQDLLALPLREAREQFERAYLQQQLLLCNGKVGQLAKRVGMERTHLYRKLRSLGVDFRNISED
jgi:DNA-binding NtrC family response regulator